LKIVKLIDCFIEVFEGSYLSAIEGVDGVSFILYASDDFSALRRENLFSLDEFTYLAKH
jgi:hypothetical protein